MPECKVTMTASAGVIIKCAGKTVLIDALHDKKAPAFSVVPPDVVETVINSPEFAEPDIVIVTHDHPDHYSRELIRRELEKYPNAAFFAPFEDFPGQKLLAGYRVRTEVAGVKLDFKKTLHEGKIYEHVPNYACLMDFGGFTVLDVGDTQTGDPEIRDWLDGRRLDLAILTFPWYELTKGRNMVDDDICPRHILLNHLPFEKDDENHYRQATVRRLSQDPAHVDLRVMWEPLQEEIFS